MPRKSFRPGTERCNGCHHTVLSKDMGEIIGEGRRPTIRRCDDCMWRIMREMGTPSPAAVLKQVLNNPPRPRPETTTEQEIPFNDNQE